MTKMMLGELCYGTIRKDLSENREYMDLGCFAVTSIDEAKRRAKELDAKHPEWSKKNPVVRFTRILVCEIKCEIDAASNKEAT